MSIDKLRPVYDYLDADIIHASLINQDIDDVERVAAALSVQNERVQIVRRVVRKEVERRIQTTRDERAKFDQEIASLHGLAYILSDSYRSTKPRETDNSESLLSGSVDLNTYSGALESMNYGHTRTVIRNSWRLLIGIAGRQAHQTSLPDGRLVGMPSDKGKCSLPTPQNIDPSSYFSIRALDQAAIDVAAFTEVVGFVNLHGSHYSDQLKGIEQLTGKSQPATQYHYFVAWADFATLCSLSPISGAQQP